MKVVNIEGGSMAEYSELMKLGKMLKREIVYFAFDREHPDDILVRALEVFDSRKKEE